MREQQVFRQHARKILDVAERSGKHDDLGMEQQILKSWKRCLNDTQLDPLAARDPLVIEKQPLSELLERYDGMLKLARPELRRLAQGLQGSGYAVILTDSKGLVLEQVVDDGIADGFRKAGLCPGADWGETHAGTNGIGTCIAELKPVTVHRDEHFLSQNIDLTCSAAPINDPHGNLLAVLDSSHCSSDDSRASQTLSRALVANYARVIESHNFLHEFRNQRVLRFHQRAEFVSLPNEALVAIGEDNRILAANDVSLHMLQMTNRSELVGKDLAQLIGRDLDHLLLHTGGKLGTIRSFRDQRSGSQLFGFIYQHARRPRPSGLTVPSSTPVSIEECRGALCNLDSLAGNDPRMQESAQRARRVVNKRIPILLQGETGTGKDLFSQAVHRTSDRKDQPFVALNCASIPESLIESELFGYKHGAFTGARREGHRGKLIESSQGTLFLDEIGDMPLTMQSRLLRVLETQEVVPLGASDPIKVDLNIIAATHRDLMQLVADGTFREDLYYRLNGITLYLTPLRERNDLRELVLKVFEAENDTGRNLRLSHTAMQILLDQPWPGNLRQLRNVVRTAVALCEDDVIELDHINLPAIDQNRYTPNAATQTAQQTDDTSDEQTCSNPLRMAENQVILEALNAQRWNISRTAESLNMSRNTLYRKMRKHGIKPDRE